MTLREIQVGDRITYANGEVVEVIGVPELNGGPGCMLKPASGQSIWMASDALVPAEKLISRINAGIYKIRKGKKT